MMLCDKIWANIKNQAMLVASDQFFPGSIPRINRPCQANLILIAYASSEGSDEPAHPRSLARTSAAGSYKQ